MSFQVSGAVCGEMLVTLAIGAAMSGGHIDQFVSMNFVAMSAGVLMCVGLASALRAAAALLPPLPSGHDKLAEEEVEEKQNLILTGDEQTLR
eukprot:SAG31_NODE_27429_length_426_cov_0.785933_1_plen_92_part_00